MKRFRYILAGLLLFSLGACEDFMDKEPLDFGSDGVYFTNVNDLANFNNNFYRLFPGMSTWWGGIYVADNNSDNQASHTPNPDFYQGEKQTPLLRNSEWRFEVIRDVNYFIQIVNERIESKAISGSEELINHYLGEAYFFRAYEYFRLLSTLGDAPIIDTQLPDDFETLKAVSQRAPRNEVARFALADLDRAAALMLPAPPHSGRLSRDAALIMKARVALFEGTWLKYHQGTAFVPGSDKWPGKEFYPDFRFVAGSITDEYNFFFDEAIMAADEVASARLLHPVYQELFNRTSGIHSINEVVLARHYVQGIASHGGTHYLLRTGAGTGLTKAFVDNFLLDNGLPIYADQDGSYEGDVMVHFALKNRDLRLVSSVKDAGFVTDEYVVDGVTVKDTIVDYLPLINIVGNQGTATGYELKKWISYEPGQDNMGAGTSAVPVFRAAEAYLVYLEAYYERHGALDGKGDTYWRALRTRAGVNPDYPITIQATDMERESDLAVKSGSAYVSPTLYNIRRERRTEFVAEGMRFLDLKRWRALDHMVNYNIEGINLWEQLYQFYNPDDIRAGVVSQRGMGNYVQPLKLNPSAEYYLGYTFPKAHYLEPLPVSEIVLTSENGNVAESPIYQNPGWPSGISGTADYGADFD